MQVEVAQLAWREGERAVGNGRPLRNGQCSVTGAVPQGAGQCRNDRAALAVCIINC